MLLLTLRTTSTIHKLFGKMSLGMIGFFFFLICGLPINLEFNGAGQFIAFCYHKLKTCYSLVELFYVYGFNLLNLVAQNFLIIGIQLILNCCCPYF